MKGGKPIRTNLLEDGNITLTFEGGTTYSMSYKSGSTVSDLTDANGKLFVFDAQKLIDAQRAAQ